VTGAINSTHTEINTVTDGSTAATATTLVDADRVPVNDDGVMVQAAMSDFKTYMLAAANTSGAITSINGITYPTSDGSAGQFMTTDGSGTLSFSTLVAFVSGMIMPFAGATAPTGWLVCYGQAVSRTTYAALFTALGTVYGSGDGSTTFNLPDLRGRTVAGQDDMGGTSADRLTSPINGDTLGATGGSEGHTLALTEMPNSFYWNSNLPAVDDTVDNYAANNFTANIADVNAHTTQGGGGTHNNMQPTIVLNYIIKT
jgi:microcystin-dependent protein